METMYYFPLFDYYYTKSGVRLPVGLMARREEMICLMIAVMRKIKELVEKVVV
jgi:hypothetical protein